MATVALADNGNDQVIEDDDTYVSSARTQTTYAVLPPVDDGSTTTVAVGYEIRFEATGGSPIVIKTADGRRVGTCPGRGQAVVVAEAGANESETDFWRFKVLANAPASNSTAASESHSSFGDSDADLLGAAINANRQVLIDAGLMKAE